MGKYITITLLTLMVMGWAPSSHSKTRTLSFKEALREALERNIDIKIAKLDEELGEAAIDKNEAIFDFILTGKINWRDDQDKPSSIVIGTRKITQDYNVGLSKKMSSGTNFKLEYLSFYKKTDSIFVTLKRYWDPQLALTITHPLLQNFFGYIDRRKLLEGTLQDKILNHRSKDRIEAALAAVAKNYWELSSAQENIRIKKRSLKQARKLYNANKKKIKLGIIENTDLLASKAHVSERKNDLLLAQNRWERVHTRFKQSLFDESTTTVHAKEPLKFQDVPFKFSTSLTRALNHRKDYLRAQETLKLKKTSLEISKNALLPTLDLVGLIATNGLDPEYDRASEDILSFNFPTYSFGVQLRYPLGNDAAQATYKTSRVERMTALYELQRLQNNIHLDISKSIDLLNTHKKQVRAVANTMKLHRKKMVEEEKKFAQGRSSINFLIDFQEDYLRSSSAHIAALVIYENARIDLKRSEGLLLDKYLKEML